jgi:hypothetical protein
MRAASLVGSEVEAPGQVTLDHAAKQQRPDNDPCAGSEGSDLALSGGRKFGIGCCHGAHLAVSQGVYRR